MIFEQFHLPTLGHASYLVGCERTGQALVFDPRRDVEDYLAAARRHGLQIRYVMDSHGHNDYLSGLTELVARTGAQPLAPVEAEVGYFSQALRDREIVEFGDVAVQSLATPGHTPEHTSLLVSDRTVGDEPALLLSGGALLVGDVARPDLLGGPDQVRVAAAEFCRTLAETILSLPDGVQVWPTHVAGSLCGGNIGSRLSTTIGYERATNPVLARLADPDGSTAECLRLDTLPAVPPYWGRMRTQNLTGVDRLGVLAEPVALTPAQFVDAQLDGMTVLDTRAPEAFAGGHIPGAVNVGLDGPFPTWAGTVLPADAMIVLVLDDPAQLWAAAWHLLRIGYPLPVGRLAGGMNAWSTAGQPVRQLPAIDVHELRRRLDAGDLPVLDVRQPAEWAGGHIPGARFVTGAEIPATDPATIDRPTAVVCGSGYRSSVVASLLAGDGAPVLNVLGGMTAWTAAGYPTTQDGAGR